MLRYSSIKWDSEYCVAAEAGGGTRISQQGTLIYSRRQWRDHRW